MIQFAALESVADAKVLPLPSSCAARNNSTVAFAFRPPGVADEERVVPVAAVLGHSDPWLRVAAANALGAMGQTARGAVAALKSAEKDDNKLVRAAARLALRRIKGRGD